MNGPSLRQQLAEYLLAQDDSPAAETFRAYVELGDEATARSAREARAIAQQLLRALEPTAPPPQLRQELSRRVRDARHVAITRAADHPDQFSQRRLRSFTPPASLAAAIALVLVSLVALYGVRQNIRAQRTVPVAQELSVAPRRHIDALAGLPVGFEQLLRNYFELVPLRTQDANERGAGRLLYSPVHRLCFVFAPSLQGAGNDQAMYDLRITPHESEPFVAGRFTVDQTGWSLFRLDWPAETDQQLSARAAVVRVDPSRSTDPVEELLVGNISR